MTNRRRERRKGDTPLNVVPMADQSTMVVACWRRITPRVARVRRSAGRTGRRTRPSTGDRSTAPMRRPAFFLLRTSVTPSLSQVAYSLRLSNLQAADASFAIGSAQEHNVEQVRH